MQNQTMFALVRSELYEKRFERFQINHAGTLMSVRPGLGGVQTRGCRMIDISRGGACFSVLTTNDLPEHYYLTIIGTQKRIGCAEIHRGSDRIRVHFIKPIDEQMLHAIVRHDFFTGSTPAPARRH